MSIEFFAEKEADFYCNYYIKLVNTLYVYICCIITNYSIYLFQ